MNEVIFVYGPPGTGKTTIGRSLAEGLGMPFTDLDERIAAEDGRTIPEIFAAEGEAGFRALESRALADFLENSGGVLALGGGALLAEENRRAAESTGPILCVQIDYDSLLARNRLAAQDRPLLSDNLAEDLHNLLAARAGHYASFPVQVDISELTPEEAAWESQIRLGFFHLRAMGQGYDVRIRPGIRQEAGAICHARDFGPPAGLITDSTVGGFYAEELKSSFESAGLPVHLIEFPPGENQKSVGCLEQLWERFIASGMERGSTVAALGGGVVGDLAGFAAATYMRGIDWVSLPTSLLAMVDASLGGKTGINLPQGKNLAGAFYPPRLVLADPNVLATLPAEELRSGLAEVVKHGIIGDARLFAVCDQGLETLEEDWSQVVRRAMAVKIRVIEEDPYELGLRACLNFGHTIGHAVEHASGYRLRHGEAVAIGMAAETRLAESTGLAVPGLAAQLADVLDRLGLPTEIPGDLPDETLLRVMARDKKTVRGQFRLALPRTIGDIQIGIVIEDLDRRLPELRRKRGGYG